MDMALDRKRVKAIREDAVERDGGTGWWEGDTKTVLALCDTALALMAAEDDYKDMVAAEQVHLKNALTDLELCEAGKERLALSYSAAGLERDRLQKMLDTILDAWYSPRWPRMDGIMEDARAALEAEK